MHIDLGPDDFRVLAHQAIEAVCDQLGALPEAPARPRLAAEVRERLLNQSLPVDGVEPGALIRRVRDEVLAFPMGNVSPRFFAWVNSPAAPLGVIGELLGAAMNSSVAGGEHAATYVEYCVLAWMKQMLGLSNQADAVLTSGGSMANLLCLGAMRHAKTAGAVRRDGMCQSSQPKLIYVTDQGHSAIQRAVEVLGFGFQHMRKVRCDSQFRMCTASLRKQVETDIQDGFEPVCVAASAGTVNTGAVDPLAEIAAICQRHDLWFHIDASYGGFATLLPQLADVFDGFTQADSIAVDPHKWLYVPLACGCALVARKDELRSSFSILPDYLGDGDLPWLSEYSIEQTRGFRALKLWMMLQHVGVSGYQKLIRRDIELNHFLREQIHSRPQFRLCAAGPLSVSCFLYDPGTLEDVEQVNRGILAKVQQEGEVFLTSTRLHGEYVLRSCIVNFRTTESSIIAMLDAIAGAAEDVKASGL